MKKNILWIMAVIAALSIGIIATRLYTVRKTVEVEAKKESKPLFYRHPMNPAVTSLSPQKDEMGMDYMPVYEEDVKEEETPGTIRLSQEKIQKIGVKSEEVKRRHLKRTIRTVGMVNHDETKVFDVTTKISGWVEKLHIDKTDEMVHPGTKLLELYSPELVSTQEEYLLAIKMQEQPKDTSILPSPLAGESRERGLSDVLIRAAEARLKYWDISDEQIQRLKNDGAITKTMTVYSPAHGIITEKSVNTGMKIEPGEILFKIIDHSDVWVLGEVYEYELPYIKIGSKARIIPSYTPADVYTAEIDHIYTHFGTIRHEGAAAMEESRTAKIRFSLPNPGHKLKLGMYVNVDIALTIKENAVSAPIDSIIDTGVRKIVIIDKGDGRFEPREVSIGEAGDDYYEITSGVSAGEKVVTSANFLIDSESNLKAALSGMAGMEHKNP